MMSFTKAKAELEELGWQLVRLDVDIALCLRVFQGNVELRLMHYYSDNWFTYTDKDLSLTEEDLATCVAAQKESA